ncbi:uncharacterized protein LOC132749771 isoform X2 [Ruditapes philippinarum]|nr:uncharacterized protein LOC132749771 isoform X2 [Ruditapes philippinarum]
MLYYMFITLGDLFFAINCLFVGINIAFKDVYVFKVFGVCLTLMLVLGVVAYEWSAICIILLIIDLVWTIKNPFSDNKKMKIFSKIGCIWTFFIGIIIAIGPFLYWNEAKFELPFCSIGNLYGKHLAVYQYEAVIVLTTLVAIMIVVSMILLYQVYKSHAISEETYEPRTPTMPDDSKKRKQNKVGDSGSEKNDQEVSTISTTLVSKMDIVSDVEGHVIETNQSKTHGEVNSAFVGDIGDIVEELRQANAERREAEKEKTKKIEVDNTAYYTRREVRRREFNSACRTVGVFMAAYLGCCMPYLIWNALGLACGSTCSDNDRPETRAIRALVATALYLLPVIDPILYTRRFDVFKKATFGMLLKLCPCKKERPSTLQY